MPTRFKSDNNDWITVYPSVNCAAKSAPGFSRSNPKFSNTSGPTSSRTPLSFHLSNFRLRKHKFEE